MRSRGLRLSFLKVLAAFAWADGTVEADERNRIKVLFNVFDLDAADRREIDALLDDAVSFERAIELTKEFAGMLAPPGARRELLDEIEALLGDEEARTDAERELLDHARSILASHTVVDALADRFRGLFARVFRERGGADDGREADRNLAALVDVLRAHVGRVDGGWADGEPDLQRVCSETCRLTTMDERIGILEKLFEAAVADGLASKAEVEEIRRIADLLWISLPEYLAVRDRVRDRIES